MCLPNIVHVFSYTAINPACSELKPRNPVAWGLPNVSPRCRQMGDRAESKADGRTGASSSKQADGASPSKQCANTQVVAFR